MSNNIAFVLINTEMGTERDVLVALRKMPEVKEAYYVYGVYDIVAMVESESVDRIKLVINNQIRGIPKVRATLTMMSAEILDANRKPLTAPVPSP